VTHQMRELQAKLAQAEQNARLAIGEGRVQDAEKAMEEVRALRKQIDFLKELEAQEKQEIEASLPKGERKDKAELEQQYTKAFVKAIRRRELTADEIDVVNSYRRHVLNVMHEGGVADPDGDSSLIVPQDIQTRINTIMRELNDLSQYIRVETVNTLSGSRVLEKDETMTPLQVVDEYAEIPELDNPKFVPVTYQLKKRAGYLPLTNELLRDSDQNILNYVTNWIGRKVVVTRNSLIAAQLNALPDNVVADLDGIKRILNVELDPAISQNAVIITNQDGFNWLDTQKDNQGRYLVTIDVTQPGRRLLLGRPIVVVSNRYLPSREDTSAGKTYAPIFIGQGDQYAVWFTRGTYELASTREGGQAWRRDSTELRVITRDDLKVWDEAAMVKGLLDVTPVV